MPLLGGSQHLKCNGLALHVICADRVVGLIAGQLIDTRQGYSICDILRHEKL